MFCPEGRWTLDRVISHIGGALFEIIDLNKLSKMFPDEDLNNPFREGYLRFLIQQIIFHTIIETKKSLAVSSPHGVTMNISPAIAARAEFSDRNDMREMLGIDNLRLDYLFIHPDLFFLTTAYWENHAKKIYIEYADKQEVAELAELALAIEKFEGWGISLSDDDVPKKSEEFQYYIDEMWPNFSQSKPVVGRSNKVRPLAERLISLYPDPAKKPAWKVMRQEVSSAGPEVSIATVKRAWEMRLEMESDKSGSE